MNGELEPAPMTASVPSLLARLAATHAAAVAIVLPDGTELSFAELQAAADRVRTRIPSGRRVGVRLANDIDSVTSVHAVWQASGSVVAVSSLEPEDEAHRRLTEVGAAAYLHPGAEPRVESVPGSPARPEADEAVIMFTSGTTGRPKAAQLTFAALEASLRGIANGSGLPDAGRSPVIPMRHPRPVFVPLSHMGGLLGSLTAWFLGSPILLCPRWSTDLAFDIIDRFPITALGVTPAMVYDLAHAAGERRLGAVKSVGVGTAPLSEPTRVAFETRYGVPVLRNYGQTEFAGAIAFERYDDAIGGRRPAGSVGRLARGVEVRIVDDAGEDLPEGSIGEIVARGGSAMRGYLGGNGADGPDSQGWIRTGDIGFLHDSDMLTVVGRTRDMVICGGFNVYPSQVEAAINRLPNVIDSAVAGFPDERLGEVPVAVVVAGRDVAPTLDDVRRELRHALAPYELPRMMRIVEAIPRTQGGKVDRPAVASLFARVS